MMAQTTDEWLEILGGHVPFAPVLDIGQALESEYVASVEMTATVAHPETPEGLRTLSSPFRVNGVRPSLSRAPKMGEHSAELLPNKENA